MANLDRTTARALVEAGYMPLSVYLQLFGEAVANAQDAPLVPDLHCSEAVSRVRGNAHHH